MIQYRNAIKALVNQFHNVLLVGRTFIAVTYNIRIFAKLIFTVQFFNYGYIKSRGGF